MQDFKLLQDAGIDTGEGMAYCADDPEFYVEMLEEFVEESDWQTGELRRYYDQRDWKNYAIRAHSVKSTLRMIGAKALSEHARGLELAAKEANEGAITSAHDEFVREYSALVSVINSCLG